MAESLIDVREPARYEVKQLSPVDPLSAVEALVEEGLAEHYWMYGSDAETVIALNPIGEVTLSNNQIQAKWDGSEMSSEIATGPFAQAGRLLDNMPIKDWRAFGHISFDASSYYYPYPVSASTPQLRFIIPKTELVISDDATILRTLEDVEEITGAVRDAVALSNAKPNAPTPDFTDRESYERKVAALVKDIRAGHLAKAILSRQVFLPGSIDIFSTYNSIRRANPAARTYCFSGEGLSGIGSSPELLMQTAENRLILTNTLAGTRPRGGDQSHDTALMEELLSDPKEVSEHVMSVRLAQEELKSVCKLGSVCIKPFMEVALFRTVQHLSSSLVGELSSEQTLWNGLKALFPGVTVSGIDKFTAIERIAAIEERARGPYAGCVGWVNSKGYSDFAITLRSAFEDNDGVSISAGAGIVAASVPEREYEETAHKMRTIQTQLVFR